MKGLYTVHGGDGKPDVIFIASGELASLCCVSTSPLLMSMTRRHRPALDLTCRRAFMQKHMCNRRCKSRRCNWINAPRCTRQEVWGEELWHAGSELCLAIDAAKEIEASGKKARVVSAVCWELFEDQDESYKNSVLPPDVTARVGYPHHLETRCVCRVFLHSINSSCLCSCTCLGPHSNHSRGRKESGLRSERRLLCRRSPWRLAAPSDGRGTWAPRASPLAWTASAPLPPAPPSTRSLASPRRPPWLLPSL